MAQKAIRTSVFSWEGTDRKGSKVKGELSGASPALVKAQLRKQDQSTESAQEVRISVWSGQEN